jgi:hypothetical protein
MFAGGRGGYVDSGADFILHVVVEPVDHVTDVIIDFDHDKHNHNVHDIHNTARHDHHSPRTAGHRSGSRGPRWGRAVPGGGPGSWWRLARRRPLDHESTGKVLDR